jgi:hypothetical protein
MANLTRQTERRGSRRVPVALDAVLYYNSLMLPDCRVWNLTPDGAFVSTGGQFLPDQATVDLAISTQVGGMPQRFSAVITRCTEQGVGVRLRDVNPATMRSLIETLYSV